MQPDSYLHWLTENTLTRWWHDSGDPEELAAGLAHGASGVTTNPVLTIQTLLARPEYWRNLAGPIQANLTKEERAIFLLRLVACHTAARLEPLYRSSGGKTGYVCAQVNPSKAGDRETMLAQARSFAAWAPNIAVKLPVTAAGLDVLEECTAEGIPVTATVSFTVPQVITVAERHRAGARRARQAGILPGQCFAVIMIGRLDDYLQEVAQDNRTTVDEADIHQAGLAVTKQAYQLFRAGGYEAVLLVAALRGAYHMTGLAGADLIMSIHPRYQAVLLEQGVPRRAGIQEPVDPQALRRLQAMPEFVRAYEPDGMRPEEFVSYGVTQRTLAQFIEAGWAQLEAYRF